MGPTAELGPGELLKGGPAEREQCSLPPPSPSPFPLEQDVSTAAWSLCARGGRQRWGRGAGGGGFILNEEAERWQFRK